MPLLTSGTHRRRDRALNAAAWLTLAGLLALVVGSLPASAASSARCITGAAGPPPATNASDLGKFLVGGESLSLRFDESKERQTAAITIDAYTNPSISTVPRNLTASIEDDVVSDQQRRIGYAFTVAAKVAYVGNSVDPTTVRICVELDPKRITDLHPGRYTGAVVLRARNFQSAAIPIDATFRAPRNDGVAMAAAGVGVGLLVKLLTELGSGRRARTGGAGRALRNYIFQWSFPLALILGVLTGWLGFVELYGSNATWGVGGDADALKLFGTCFGFQMGSIGGADMTKRLAG